MLECGVAEQGVPRTRGPFSLSIDNQINRIVQVKVNYMIFGGPNVLQASHFRDSECTLALARVLNQLQP